MRFRHSIAGVLVLAAGAAAQNAAPPGPVQPAALTALMEPFRRGIPMQRLPKPTDYGLAAAFLVSDDAAMITGTDLRVDAGALARYWAWDPAQAAVGG